MNAPVVPRPAATVILARDTDRGIEIFMMKRTEAVEFAKGMHVFPGGAVDAADRSTEMALHCAGLDDRRASERLGLGEGGLAYWIAAIRECFEEAGLLLGYRDADELVRLEGAEAERFAKRRAALAASEITFLDLLRAERLRAATDRLAYYSHWLTQAGRPRRYDTRFFVARAPATQIAAHDDYETVAHLWVRPADALAMHQQGNLNLMFPTVKTLESLAKFARVEELIEFAHTPRVMPTMAPRSAITKDGKPRFLIPGDFAYAEVGKLDPGNKGIVKSEIVPGEVVRLSETVRRITAPNPGMMTGPGTNTYLIGRDGEALAVLDPGPALDTHIDAIITAAGNAPIRWILCSHTHIDHSPAARMLGERTGATILGMPPPPHSNQDQTFAPNHVVRHGERLALGGLNLRVIHTPGHASNQCCYLLEEEKLLFTGDHIMQGSTVVINPPDGDMATYLASLRLLLAEDLEYLAPGHGFLIGRPHEAVERLLVHRQQRENKVITALRRAGGPAALEALVPSAYDDTPARLHGVAARSLLAHLQKLRQEGRAVEEDGRWRFVGN